MTAPWATISPGASRNPFKRDPEALAGALIGKYHLSNPNVLEVAKFGVDGRDDFLEPIIRNLLADKNIAAKDRTLLQFSLARLLKDKAGVAKMSDQSITWRYGCDYIAKFRKRDVAPATRQAVAIGTSFPW
jgi:hypothetical protein